MPGAAVVAPGIAASREAAAALAPGQLGPLLDQLPAEDGVAEAVDEEVDGGVDGQKDQVEHHHHVGPSGNRIVYIKFIKSANL